MTLGDQTNPDAASHILTLVHSYIHPTPSFLFLHKDDVELSKADAASTGDGDDGEADGTKRGHHGGGGGGGGHADK